jgi:hypothetical protein
MDDETTGKAPDENAGVPPAEAKQAAGAQAEEAGAETSTTSALQPDDEGATHVLSGEPSDATQVMSPVGAAAGAPPPPPPRPSPTLMMSHAPRRRSSKAWWIVLLVIVLAAAAAAAIWFFLLRTGEAEVTPSSSPSPTANWSGAWGLTDGSGGGLIIQGSGGKYQVTMYDGALHPLGVATAKTSGDELQFSLDSQEAVGGLSGPLMITLTFGQTQDSAQMTIVSAGQNTVTLDLARVSSLLPASPSSSPSPTPSTSTTASPSPSQSPTTSADQQVINGTTKIQVGIITWSTNNNNLFPVAGEVAQSGGIAQYVTPWPINPYTNLPMKPGTQPGDYTYEQINGGSAYKLTGYLNNGLTYVLP